MGNVVLPIDLFLAGVVLLVLIIVLHFFHPLSKFEISSLYTTIDGSVV